MSDQTVTTTEAVKSYFILLSHSVTSVYMNPVSINVLVRGTTPNIDKATMEQAAINAANTAGETFPGIEITGVALVARIDLGYMTDAEFDNGDSPSAATAAQATVQ